MGRMSSIMRPLVDTLDQANDEAYVERNEDIIKPNGSENTP
jgi:hypothetical protein